MDQDAQHLKKKDLIEEERNRESKQCSDSSRRDRESTFCCLERMTCRQVMRDMAQSIPDYVQEGERVNGQSSCSENGKSTVNTLLRVRLLLIDSDQSCEHRSRKCRCGRTKQKYENSGSRQILQSTFLSVFP